MTQKQKHQHSTRSDHIRCLAAALVGSMWLFMIAPSATGQVSLAQAPLGPEGLPFGATPRQSDPAGAVKTTSLINQYDSSQDLADVVGKNWFGIEIIVFEYINSATSAAAGEDLLRTDKRALPNKIMDLSFASQPIACLSGTNNLRQETIPYGLRSALAPGHEPELFSESDAVSSQVLLDTASASLNRVDQNNLTWPDPANSGQLLMSESFMDASLDTIQAAEPEFPTEPGALVRQPLASEQTLMRNSGEGETSGELVDDSSNATSPAAQSVAVRNFERLLEAHQRTLEKAAYRWQANALQLSTEASRINATADKRVLLHRRWQQPVPPRSEPEFILITGDTAASPTQDLGREKRPETAGFSIAPSQFYGIVDVTLGRYLHFDADLWLYQEPVLTSSENATTPRAKSRAGDADALRISQPNQPLTTYVQEITAASSGITSDDGKILPDQTAQASPIPYIQLLQSRRMRSGELHYIDHPRLGLLVRIDPLPLPASLESAWEAVVAERDALQDSAKLN